MCFQCVCGFICSVLCTHSPTQPTLCWMLLPLMLDTHGQSLRWYSGLRCFVAALRLQKKALHRRMTFTVLHDFQWAKRCCPVLGGDKCHKCNVSCHIDVGNVSWWFGALTLHQYPNRITVSQVTLTTQVLCICHCGTSVRVCDAAVPPVVQTV